MIRNFFAILSLALVFLTAGCGGMSAPSKPEGPTLSISDIQSLVLDQFYINDKVNNEFSSKRFSVYLRDAVTGEDIVCTSGDDGMKRLSTTGIYYGGLSVPLREVEGEHPSSTALFQVVFVRKSSEDCPKPVNPEDETIGQSLQFSFENLLGKRIVSENNAGMAVLRFSGDDVLTVAPMDPLVQPGLIVDKLYFDDGSDGSKTMHYYLFAQRIENGAVLRQCSVDDSLMSKIGSGGIVYAALNFPITCLDSADPAFASFNVKIELYVQRESGPELIGETESTQISSLIGAKVPFTNESGYISFRKVAAE